MPSEVSEVKNKRMNIQMVKSSDEDVFFPPFLFSSTVGLEPPPLSVSEERHLAILTELPFVVPFEERVKVPKSVSRVSACQTT